MNATLALSDDYTNKTAEVTVKAYKTADEALVVHRRTWITKDGIVSGKTWAITHTPTGLIILSGYTKKDRAIEGARQLSELARWDGITVENAPDWYKVNCQYVMDIKKQVS